MSTITLPNIRVSSDLEIRLKLKDGGVAIDWSTLTNIKASIYSDRQRSLAGRCDIAIDEDDATVLVCRYSANKPQYPGVNRVIVSCTYDGETKTYDKPALNFVRWTDDQAGQQITIDDPDIDVEISVEDVSSSILQEAVEAANSAAERANDAAAAAEHMVDIHQGPPGEDGKSPYIGENGHWYEWDEDAGEYVDTETEAQGETGTTPDITIGTVTTAEPGTPAAATMTGTPEAPVLNLTIPKGVAGDTPAFTVGEVTTGQPGTPVVVTITGTAAAPVLNVTIPQGLQGNTGSSVDYPYELVNNLTTNDATKGLSAAQGKVLKDELTQLEAEVGDPTSEYVYMGQPTEGYYNLSGSAVDPTPVSADRAYNIRTASKQGDKYIVYGTGGTNARLWGFVDGEGNILDVADEDADNRETPAVLTAPSGTAEVIFNFSNFNPITDWSGKNSVVSLSEQVETKTKTIYTLEGQTLSSGYYNLSGSTLPTSSTSSGNYNSIILEGNPGDMFQIVGVSSTSTNARLWATGDASRGRVRYASTNQDARTNPATITLQTGEKYLYVNLYLQTSTDGVSIVKVSTKRTDLLTRVKDLEETTAKRGTPTKKSFVCMRGALSYVDGLYPSASFYPQMSHTPSFIKNYGKFKVLYAGGEYRIAFYDANQSFIDYVSVLEPDVFERGDASYFRVWTREENVRSIEIESYWTGDDEVFQKLPADEGYQGFGFGVNLNKGVIPNDEGTPTITTGYVSTYNFGVLHLPSSYRETGCATPLIIYLHGAGDRYKVGDNRFGANVRYSPEWDAMGFAQMDVDMIPEVYNTGTSTDAQAGTGDDAACVEAAYNWAIQHFNIRRDGVYLFGRSRGGQAVLECLAKFNPSKLPVVCALSNAGANAMLLYSLFRTGNSTFWRIFCESTGLDALNPPAYSSGLIIANSTIADFLRTNIGIWWDKAMVALRMCVDNPTEYQTPTQIFDLLVSSYTSENPGKTFIEDFIERCKFRSPVPLRFDWCHGDTTQPWESTPYGNYGSAGKDGFVNNKLTGNAIYRRWASCPPGDNAHFHEMFNLEDYTLPNGVEIEDASMAMTEWLLWAMGQDERFTI